MSDHDYSDSIMKAKGEETTPTVFTLEEEAMISSITQDLENSLQQHATNPFQTEASAVPETPEIIQTILDFKQNSDAIEDIISLLENSETKQVESQGGYESGYDSAPSPSSSFLSSSTTPNYPNSPLSITDDYDEFEPKMDFSEIFPNLDFNDLLT